MRRSVNKASLEEISRAKDIVDARMAKSSSRATPMSDEQLRTLELELRGGISGFVEKNASAAVRYAAPQDVPEARLDEIAGSITKMKNRYAAAGLIFALLESPESFNEITRSAGSIDRLGTWAGAAKVYAARETRNFYMLASQKLDTPEANSLFNASEKEVTSEILGQVGSTSNFHSISAMWDGSITSREKVLKAIGRSGKIAYSLALGLAITGNEAAFLDERLLELSPILGEERFSNLLDWMRISGRPDKFLKPGVLDRIASGELNPSELASGIAHSGNNAVLLGRAGNDGHDVAVKFVGELLIKAGFRVVYVSNFGSAEEIAKEADRIRSNGFNLVGVGIGLSDGPGSRVMLDTPKLIDKNGFEGVKFFAGGALSLPALDELAYNGIRLFTPGSDISGVVSFLRQDPEQVAFHGRTVPQGSLGGIDDTGYASFLRGRVKYYTAGGGCSIVDSFESPVAQSVARISEMRNDERIQTLQRSEEHAAEAATKAMVSGDSGGSADPNGGWRSSPWTDAAADQANSSTANATARAGAAGAPPSVAQGHREGGSADTYICPNCHTVVVPPHLCADHIG